MSRPSTSSLRDGFEEIVPIRIRGDNHSYLPCTRPVLDIVLALDGIADRLELLEVDEPLQSIPSRKAFDESGPMFKYPADKIICHPDIKNAVWSIGQNVNEGPCHAEMLQDVDGRDIGERKRRRPSDGYARP